MSSPGYPSNNRGFPGQPKQSDPKLHSPTYPVINEPHQGYPMLRAYPPNQPSFPQMYQNPFQVSSSQYFPQQSGQNQSNSAGIYASNSSMYHSSMFPSSSTVPGLYMPSPYPNIQPLSSYEQQSSYTPNQQIMSSIYPNLYSNMTTGGYGGSSQVPLQAEYLPTFAHNQSSSSSPIQKKSNATLRKESPYGEQCDTQILCNALMNRFETNETTIINFLAKRVNSQRQEIALHYKTIFGKDLIKDLKSKLSGKFKYLIESLMMPTYAFLAKEIQNAISGVATNEETIIEIVCTATNVEIKNIKNEYQKLFGKDLEKELKRVTSGSFGRLLVSLCQGQRSESTYVDEISAQEDVLNLLQAREFHFGTDESIFNMILCCRSLCQLQEIFLEYFLSTGHDIEDTIKNEFNGGIENGLKTIVKSIRDKSTYFAKRLHESLSGFVKDDRTLIRIIATRCEIDMVQIKHAYMSIYKKSLESDIADNTSGNYKRCLIALIDGQLP